MAKTGSNKKGAATSVKEVFEPSSLADLKNVLNRIRLEDDKEIKPFQDLLQKASEEYVMAPTKLKKEIPSNLKYYDELAMEQHKPTFIDLLAGSGMVESKEAARIYIERKGQAKLVDRMKLKRCHPIEDKRVPAVCKFLRDRLPMGAAKREKEERAPTPQLKRFCSRTGGGSSSSSAAAPLEDKHQDEQEMEDMMQESLSEEDSWEKENNVGGKDEEENGGDFSDDDAENEK
ncbi:unnamed protein product [Amoebophrya sp. A120]|nr:unnamed protein product [Amoebophrya sp. A120]|eukprot:GSA120T00021805001.1